MNSRQTKPNTGKLKSQIWRRRSSSESKRHFPAFEAISIVGLLLLYAICDDGVDPTILWATLAIQYALIIDSIRKPVYVQGHVPSFCGVEPLFYTFYYIIFFYPYQLYVLGLTNLDVSTYIRNDTFANQSNKAVLLAAIGAVAFRAGYRYFAPSRTFHVQSSESSRPRGLDTVSPKLISQISLLSLAALISIYTGMGYRAAGEGRYLGATSGGVLTEAIYYLIMLFSMISVAVWATTPGRRPLVTSIAAAAGTAWAFRMLLVGDRNTFLLIFLVGVAGIFTFRRQTGRLAMVVLLVAALHVYSAVETARMGTADLLTELASLDFMSDSDSNETSFNISTITLRASLAGVPDVYDYGFGIFKLIGFLGIFPFVRGIFLPQSLEFTSTSDVLTSLTLGANPTWSVGSNIVSDLYIDFGVIGVLGGLALIGILAGWIQGYVTNLPTSPWRGTIYLLTVTSLAEIPRYSADFPVRMLVWTLLVFLLLSSPIGRTRLALRRESRVSAR